MKLLSKKFIIPTVAISLLYVLLITYSMNFSLLKETLLGEFSSSYKIGILIALLDGMWTSMSGSGLTMLFLVAFLTGANRTLLFDKLRTFRGAKNLQLVVGGNSLLGIIGSGCAACGLPILSFLGLSGSIIYLPYRGAELSYIAFVLLLISFYLLVKTKQSEATCPAPVRSLSI